MSEPKSAPVKRSFLSLLPRALLSALFLLVFTIEIGSRVCDHLVESRLEDENRRREMMRQKYEPDFVESLYYGVLEYGSILRAEQQTKARNGPHPYLGYALLPNYSTPPGPGQQARHNALGFRGKETTWEKPAGVYRIVTIGGSSVYGQSETCDAAVWSQQLEDKLNAANSGRKFEVVNLGCSGWSSFEMLINLELRGLDLSPDLVIVYEAINDMRCALYTGGGEPVRDNTHWRAPWLVDRPSAIEGFLAHSRTYLVWRRYMTNYVEERADLAFFAITNYKANTGDTYVHTTDGVPIPERGFLNYRRNLNDIVSVSEARGAKVLIVTQALPRWHLDGAPRSREDQIASFDRIQDIQREVASARGVSLFECARLIEQAVEVELAAERERQRAANPSAPPEKIEELARAEVRSTGLMKSEVHPNDSGSELIARHIAEYMLGTLLAKSDGR
ncbi:MAG: SGNH/GDSL hydrolase family protein [Planctomycetes bacterium]|nr:SGNH/GDSL hydrolase family protein [Planctomycetota bacterium]